MPRRGRRIRLARSIYQDQTGRSGIYRDAEGKQREPRYPPGTPISVIRDDLERRKRLERGSGIAGARGSLAEAVDRWASQERHLASWKERRAELRAWVALYGHRLLAQITPADVRAAMGIWTEAGITPKTIRNRLWSLKHLYHVLYGKRFPTPVDDVEPPPKVRHLPRYIAPTVILQVYAQLLAFEASGRLPDAKTRARYMIRASTGRRPSEIMRARPEDVDLARRIWRVRDGKGGWSRGLVLNDDALVAWQTFSEADAWGPFNTGSMAEVLRAAGWPEGSRPYDLRASIGVDLSERGIDLIDVGEWLGHTSLQTTRSAYVPILTSRQQRASEQLAGRLQGWQIPEAVPAARASTVRQNARNAPKSDRGRRSPPERKSRT